MSDLGTCFLKSVARNPSHTAIVDGDIRISYEVLSQRVLSLVENLDRLNIVKGDRLLICLRNSWEHVALYWACQLSGVIAVPVNWRSTGADIKFFAGDLEAKGIVFDNFSLESVEGAGLDTDIVKIHIGYGDMGAIPFQALIENPLPKAASRAQPSDSSIILYTSGTMSKPKGVLRSHSAELAAAVGHLVQNFYPMQGGLLGAMPLYHTMGLRLLICSSLLGGTYVCLPRFAPAEALDQIERESIESLYMVPTMYHDLVREMSRAPRDVSSVKVVTFAGANMQRSLMERIDATFKPERFINQYGSTEIYTYTVNQSVLDNPKSVGQAGFNGRVRVVRSSSTSPLEPAAPFEVGQVAVSMASDEAFAGYWRRPEERSIRDGWYLTGDAGHLDEAGNLFLSGRVDDLIISGGENIAPAEVEACLAVHPGIEGVIVFGVPDVRWGEKLVAAVKRCQDVSDSLLADHCDKMGLARFKRPKHFLFVDRIPTSHVGKPLRRSLREGDFELEDGTHGRVALAVIGNASEES